MYESSGDETDVQMDEQQPGGQSQQVDRNRMEGTLTAREHAAYVKIKKLGQGSFGQVHMARSTITNEIVAIKKIRFPKALGGEDGIFALSKREISILRPIRHENIIELRDTFTKENSRYITHYLVFECCEYDLSELVRNQSFTLNQEHKKYVLQQLLRAVSHIHEIGIFHRDVKPSNILVTEKGILKLTDFGLSRTIAKLEDTPYTPTVVTLWYRAPEILLGDTDYTSAIDMWSVGCIMGELYTRAPLMPGNSDQTQLALISKLRGSINTLVWPNCDELQYFELFHASITGNTSSLETKMENLTECKHTINLITALLQLNPEARPSAANTLNHIYFRKQPLPTSLESVLHDFKTRDVNSSQPSGNGEHHSAASLRVDVESPPSCMDRRSPPCMYSPFSLSAYPILPSQGSNNVMPDEQKSSNQDLPEMMSKHRLIENDQDNSQTHPAAKRLKTNENSEGAISTNAEAAGNDQKEQAKQSKQKDGGPNNDKDMESKEPLLPTSAADKKLSSPPHSSDKGSRLEKWKVLEIDREPEDCRIKLVKVKDNDTGEANIKNAAASGGVRCARTKGSCMNLCSNNMTERNDMRQLHSIVDGRTLRKRPEPTSESAAKPKKDNSKKEKVVPKTNTVVKDDWAGPSGLNQGTLRKSAVTKKPHACDKMPKNSLGKDKHTKIIEKQQPGLENYSLTSLEIGTNLDSLKQEPEFTKVGHSGSAGDGIKVENIPQVESPCSVNIQEAQKAAILHDHDYLKKMPESDVRNVSSNALEPQLIEPPLRAEKPIVCKKAGCGWF